MLLNRRARHFWRSFQRYCQEHRMTNALIKVHFCLSCLSGSNTNPYNIKDKGEHTTTSRQFGMLVSRVFHTFAIKCEPNTNRHPAQVKGKLTWSTPHQPSCRSHVCAEHQQACMTTPFNNQFTSKMGCFSLFMDSHQTAISIL